MNKLLFEWVSGVRGQYTALKAVIPVNGYGGAEKLQTCGKNQAEIVITKRGAH